MVVIGHYPNISLEVKRVIYWFHMPLFFIISGYLYKSNNDKKWTKNTIIKYIVPFVAYFLLITILEQNFSIKNILLFIYGGRIYNGVYWYIPCLLITILLFKFLDNNFSKKKITLIVSGMYVLAHIESILYLPNNDNYATWSIIYKFPLNIDVCLITVFYFAIGYYNKEIINNIMIKFRPIIFIISSTFCCIIIYLSLNYNFNYNLDLKNGQYKHIILDLIIPLIFGIVLINISKLLKESKMISLLGRNSLVIMYLHIPISSVLGKYIQYNILSYLGVCITISIIFMYICSLSKYLQFLFNGKLISKTNNEKYNLKNVAQ